MKKAALLAITAVALGIHASLSQGQDAKLQEPVPLTTDQVAILKSAATLITKRKDFIFKKLKSFDTAGNLDKARAALFDTLNDEEAQIQKTQKSFERFTITSDARLASRVFFSDISDLYRLGTNSIKTFKAVEYPFIRDNTLDLFDYTRSAYMVVAQRGSLTFDLEVRSAPPEATVSLRRKGDSYATHPRVTNTTIKNLVYARWQVRAQRRGYQTQEKLYDPFQDPSRQLDFALQRE